MGTFLIVFLAVLLGLIVFGLIVFLYIRAKLVRTFGREETKMLIDAAKNSANIEKEEYSRTKEVMGLTSLLEPEIRRDFPEFSSSLLFNKVENGMSAIFNSLEAKNTSYMEKDLDLDFMTGIIKKKIEDMENDNISVKYDDIHFNGHAIKEYKKKDGAAVISVVTSVTYFYDTNRKNKKKYSDISKSTRYITKFAYVYDENKFDNRQLSFSVHCPNCGAALTRLDGVCSYCNSTVNRINLKAWKMIACDERG